MESESQVAQLEKALLSQAESLAREELRNVVVACSRIRSEAAARLKLLEERETQAAKSDAERLLRRRMQSEETRLSGELDRLRWTLSETILSRVKQALGALTQDTEHYLPVLSGFLAEAARELPPGPLVAEVNGADLDRLRPVWPEWLRSTAPDRKVELAAHGLPSVGGMRIRTADNRVRLDQTFEARLTRLKDALARSAMEQLFAGKPNLDQLIQL
jgi:V/A-type H+-transporting ATPase subunit E